MYLGRRLILEPNPGGDPAKTKGDVRMTTMNDDDTSMFLASPQTRSC